MSRKIVQIEEDRCTGCGLCAHACHESAIAMVDGKAKLIREVLSSLNADDRTIILLRDYEKMTYAEIARVTGLSETVVKVRLHRARLRYRSRYEQRGGDGCGM